MSAEQARCQNKKKSLLIFIFALMVLGQIAIMIIWHQKSTTTDLPLGPVDLEKITHNVKVKTTAIGDTKENVASANPSHQKNVKHYEQKGEDNFLPRVLAFIFPQFHQDSLNDHLWGDGFTDWDNLNKAPSKNRLGYAIPRPTELGQYDLTHLEPRKKQGELAKEYGIDGFLYHHYWFYDPDHPGPNLHAPLVEMLKDGHPDVPFALHWCAIKWTNTWSGKVREDFVYPEPNVLQKQFFPTDENDPLILEHYNWLKQFFHHPNYIKVDGKPLLMLYQRKPGAMLVFESLRKLAKKDGFPDLYITCGLSKPHLHLLDIKDEGQIKTFKQMSSRTLSLNKNLYDKVVSYPNPSEWAENRTLEVPPWCKDNVNGAGTNEPRLKDIAGIISSFDNTPRRNFEEAHLFGADDKPEIIVERFQKNLRAALYYESCCFPDKNDRLKRERKDDDRFIIINAMNEWAEGMALEPSDVYGRMFLEAIRDTKAEIRQKNCLL